MLVDETAADDELISSSESTFCESLSDSLYTDQADEENLPEILDLDGLDHSTPPSLNEEMDPHSNQPSLADDVTMAEPTGNLPFTDFVSVEMCDKPTQLDPETCLLCYFDMSLGDGRFAASKFPRKDSMQRYARLIHFRGREQDDCPDDACVGKKFIHLDHFKNHAAKEHRVFF
jgi:hypothetical protein